MLDHSSPESTLLPIGRLAPSPTGAQHVGNARTFLLAWLSIRSRQGQLILRMEDIDSPRVKPWAAQQAIDDLRWLGLDWDAGPDRPGPQAPYVQTERLERYRAALNALIAVERVYPCTCSRSDIAEAASAPHPGQEGPIYPGTCANRTAADAVKLPPNSFAWRFRTDAGNEIPPTFIDRIAGPQTCWLRRELGDFVIFKADGTPAYQLAVVVDDHEMGITEVVRGDDLLPSTFRQLALYSALGWHPPEFVHVPLVVGPDGRRLAKRHGDTRLSVLRERGIPPERLIGLLAQSCGWRASTTPISARELMADFTLTSMPPGPFVLTEDAWRSLLK